jgi:hypothetical protein
MADQITKRKKPKQKFSQSTTPQQLKKEADEKQATQSKLQETQKKIIGKEEVINNPCQAQLIKILSHQQPASTKQEEKDPVEAESMF